MYPRLNFIVIAFVFLLDGSVAFAGDLLELYNKALKNDMQLAIAGTALNVSEYRLDQSQAWMRPQMNLSGNYKENRGTYNFPSKNYSLTLTQNLFNYDHWKAIDEAEGVLVQNIAQYKDAEQDLIMRVTTAYFDLLAADDAAELAKASKLEIGQQLEQGQSRFNAGLLTRIDVLNIQSAYDLAVAQEISAHAALEDVREAIREIAGYSLDMPARLKADVPLVSPNPENIDSWAELAVQGSLDVIAQQAAVDAADDALKRSYAGHLPTLDLVAGYTFNDTSGLKFGLKTTTEYVGVQFSLPVYSGGFASAKVRESTENLVKAQYALAQTKHSVVRQGRSAYLAVVTGISLVRAHEQSVRSASELLAAIQDEYKAGSKTSLEVLAAELDLNRAGNELAQSRYEYLKTMLALKEVVSNLKFADLEAINELLNE